MAVTILPAKLSTQHTNIKTRKKLSEMLKLDRKQCKRNEKAPTKPNK